MRNDIEKQEFIDSISGTLEKYKLEPREFGALYLADVSQAGRTLQGGVAQKEFTTKQLMGELNEIDKAMFTLGEGTELARRKVLEQNEKGGLLSATSNFLSTLNKTRIGLMTVQLATTVRNTTNGYLRNYVYALDNLGSAGIEECKAKFTILSKVLYLTMKKLKRQGS